MPQSRRFNILLHASSFLLQPSSDRVELDRHRAARRQRCVKTIDRADPGIDFRVARVIDVVAREWNADSSITHVVAWNEPRDPCNKDLDPWNEALDACNENLLSRDEALDALVTLPVSG